MESVNLAEVFEAVGKPMPFKDLEVGEVFMVPGTAQFNHYWRSPKHKWQPYKSSIVFRKESDSTIQRLMTQFPAPVEQAASTELLVQPVRFIDLLPSLQNLAQPEEGDRS